MRTILLCLALLCLALLLPLHAPAAEPALADFQATLNDTVLYLKVSKVGTRLERILLTDGADSRTFLGIEGGFNPDQTLTWSVHGEQELLAQVWAAEGRLTVVGAEPLDEPNGKGWRLTYDDGTVIQIVS